MNKERSLAFLQSCINKIENATEDEINSLKYAIEKEKKRLIHSDEFEFVAPESEEEAAKYAFSITLDEKADVELNNDYYVIDSNVVKEKGDNVVFIAA